MCLMVCKIHTKFNKKRWNKRIKLVMRRELYINIAHIFSQKTKHQCYKTYFVTIWSPPPKCQNMSTTIVEKNISSLVLAELVLSCFTGTTNKQTHFMCLPPFFKNHLFLLRWHQNLDFCGKLNIVYFTH